MNRSGKQQKFSNKWPNTDHTRRYASDMVGVRRMKMESRFIDKFEVILLDMGNTFMFGMDRFGENEDYHATYCQLGGQYLGPEEVHDVITNVFGQMLSAARDPLRYDDFGDVRRFLNELDGTAKLSESENELIVEVFSRHEVGKISETHVESLRRLSSTHQLGIVSNIWSPCKVFENELDRVSIKELFTICVWSSDSLSIKPSPHLFLKALDAFSIESARIVYVGDNPMRDIAGAKNLGMAAVWIANNLRPLTSEVPDPDRIISDLTELLTVA